MSINHPQKTRRAALPLYLDPLNTPLISSSAESHAGAPRVGIYSQSITKHCPMPPIATEGQKNLPAVSTLPISLNKEMATKSDILDITAFRICYRKALEPKLRSTYVSKVGVTPRLIEIERTKRRYLSENLSQLISSSVSARMKDTELHSATPIDLMTSDNADLSSRLPLHLFDSTEYDPRTINDWLNVNTIPDNAFEALRHERAYPAGQASAANPSLRYCTTPLPAKYLDGKEWRVCIVVAYDFTTQLWKCEGRTYSPEELKKFRDNYVDPQDVNLYLLDGNSSGSSIVWMKR